MIGRPEDIRSYRIVISSEARNLFRSRSGRGCLEIPNGKPVILNAFGHRPIYTRGEAATTSLKAETALHLSPFSRRGTPEGLGVGRGRGKSQANLRPFGAPPSKGRRENRDRTSPYLYSAAFRSFDSVLLFQIIHFLTYNVFLRSG